MIAPRTNLRLLTGVVPPANHFAVSISLLASLFSLLKMLMKNYVLFVLVGGENIFHSVEGHKASRILCVKGRKYESLKLFKRFRHCLGFGARLDLLQPTQTEEGPKLYIERGVICKRLLGATYDQKNWRREPHHLFFSISLTHLQSPGPAWLHSPDMNTAPRL